MKISAGLRDLLPEIVIPDGIHMQRSAAYQRYIASKAIGFDQWHDGEGYDLEAFAQMTDQERDVEATQACELDSPDWRDLEMLRAHGGQRSIERLRHLLDHPSIDTRAHALRELIAGGHAPGSVPDVQLAYVLEAVKSDDDGMTTALLLAQEHAGPMSKLALLRGAQSNSSAAMHFAAALLDLAGASDDTAAFDSKFRPVLLKLLPDCPADERAKAFEQVCKWLGIDAGNIPSKGARDERPWAERQWGRSSVK